MTKDELEKLKEELRAKAEPIPEDLAKRILDIKQKVIAAEGKGYRMRWSEEMEKDLWAFHGLSQVEELATIMEQQIELNRLIIDEKKTFEEALKIMGLNLGFTK